ncbi:MAG: sigma-70 family RNA polymerase sigma factor [Armatimonadetes bacterium]|nr:sigma-70 family RNA polymerase sigma factor [Armatimonadota bacterium]
MIHHDSIENLVRDSQNGDEAAFNALVLQLQNLAVGAAFSIVGDWHLAQDAAQEAFIEARFELHRLQIPAQFVPWLRRLIVKHCDRLTRKKSPPLAALEQADEICAPEMTPPQWSERGEKNQMVRREIAALPRAQRDAVVLFYIGERSHREVAEFLGVPVSTVKKRLHDARQSLKRRLLRMLQDDLKEERPSNTLDFALKVRQFTGDFSRNVTGGESLVRSLLLTAEGQGDTDFANVIRQIQRDVSGDGKVGLTLSQAMGRHPEFFSDDYISAIRRGETEGNLETALQNLSAK